MNSRPANAAQKLLRLGIIHGGKIIEEQLIRKRQPVIVGESAKNTIILPSSAAVGAGFKLFDFDGASYNLTFTDQMSGRVSVEDNVLDFTTLKTQGLCKKRGDHYVLPLADKARGKVMLGDVTILFQFVAPPPEAPKPQLPASVRLSILYAIDWNYALILAALTVMVLSFLGYLKTVPIPEELTLAQIDDRFAKMIAPKLHEVEPEKPAETAKKADTPKAEKKEEKKEKPAEDEPKEVSAARKKEIQQKVAGKGVLAILGAKGMGKGAVADVFGAGNAINTDIDSAFQGISGVDVASGNNSTRRGGGSAGNSSSIGGLATSGGGKVGLGEKSEQRVGNVQSAAPEVDGGALDPAAIARVVKSRLAAVKECYERQLKRNPQLAGKVVIRFTVDEDGKVASASVEENSLGDAEVGACIVSRFERFRFPKPDGGSVTVAYPFIFSPAS